MADFYGSVITDAAAGSPAAAADVRAGDSLVRINGHIIEDVLDYRYYAYDARLLLELRRGGKIVFKRVRKRDGSELGLTFETYLMNGERSCANRCIFCFIDQLPRGMRSTLYYKDDDARLSFLQGNYITLTNMSEREIGRVIALRVSPLNVSVHTMNPELRAYMLGNPGGAGGVDVIRRLAAAGITLNCQIVLCRGVNDGAELDRTMRGLAELYPAVASVSVVPAGLTKYRGGLAKLEPYDRESARAEVERTEAFAQKCLTEYGSRIFFVADELYLKAGLGIPQDAAYEDYPQLENGVGMLRSLITEFGDALESETLRSTGAGFTAVTGLAAEKFVNELLSDAQSSGKYGTIKGRVLGAVNRFFGETVDVAGLVTGSDVIRTLRENLPVGERLLIPRNMLRHGGTMFLDDVTAEDVEREFGVAVRVVENDGADLLRAMLGH
ncbi:MAG: DUF512 domain-containing protein [Oscillospiraceae bacterium]|nr:DUF512 domain-containing protein [Oscillospiraceae bacterium]